MTRCDRLQPTGLFVDEASFQKRHKYVMAVTDPDASHVCCMSPMIDARPAGSSSIPVWMDAQKAAIMDTWPAVIAATLRSIPDAATKIAFDKFHVAKLLGDAVDKVRRQEHRQLSEEGMEVLKGSKYAWLTHPENMTVAQRLCFLALCDRALQTARGMGDQA